MGNYLISNHPCVDGNKRIGILAVLVYLELNGIEVTATDDELIQLGLGLAEGSVTDKDLLDWILDHKFRYRKRNCAIEKRVAERKGRH